MMPQRSPEESSYFAKCSYRVKTNSMFHAYIRSLTDIFILPYPLTQKRDIAVLPRGFLGFFQRRGISELIECYCGHFSESPRPIRVTTYLGGATIAHCNTVPSRCGYFVELNDAFHQMGFRSHYGGIITLEQHQTRFMRSSDAQLLLPAAFNSSLDISHYCRPIPKFHGLLASDRPLMIARSRDAKRRRSEADHLGTLEKRRREGSFNILEDIDPLVLAKMDDDADEVEVVAGPSRVLEVFASEMDANGSGLLECEFEHLKSNAEKCDGCKRFFTRNGLRAHIPGCTKNKGKKRVY
ncbi:hypothetical protein SCHPADRAFT_935634 [Schizopora paradoxa]|uniref:Uncharacterized protein n=1 Tax=Schizopora paradoxa TaxID=27342 RepID=A0A0H2SBE9_9AGAM|nr:hypothetical protein SCHPADRAFT_935634 [Schizopora paradoxa]